MSKKEEKIIVPEEIKLVIDKEIIEMGSKEVKEDLGLNDILTDKDYVKFWKEYGWEGLRYPFEDKLTTPEMVNFLLDTYEPVGQYIEKRLKFEDNGYQYMIYLFGSLEGGGYHPLLNWTGYKISLQTVKDTLKDE